MTVHAVLLQRCNISRDPTKQLCPNQGNCCRQIPGSSHISQIHFTFCKPHRHTEDQGTHPSFAYLQYSTKQRFPSAVLPISHNEAHDLFPAFEEFHPRFITFSSDSASSLPSTRMPSIIPSLMK
ncbi:hypothetical protein BST61_g9254 [Cercospora zeina]